MRALQAKATCSHVVISNNPNVMDLYLFVHWSMTRGQNKKTALKLGHKMGVVTSPSSSRGFEADSDEIGNND